MAKTEELVALSGVSRSTVFRFLKGDSIRPEARNAILSAMQQLNMQHNHRHVPKGSTLVISIRPDFKSFKGYGLSMVGFMNRAEIHGYKVQLKTETSGPKSKIKKQNRKVVGVLILGKTIREEDKEIAQLLSAGIPHVLVNRMFTDPRVSWVSVDIQTAACDAVSHLIDLGHTNIGTWGATSSYRIDRNKRLGYIQAFEKRGLPVPDCCFDDNDQNVLATVVHELISNKKLPSAWFSPSDEIAMRLSKIFRDNGLSIPNDVAIVGMDDVEPAAYMNPALTSIHIPYQNAGVSACDVLKQLIENPGTVSHRVILEHRLVVRESCGTS